MLNLKQKLSRQWKPASSQSLKKFKLSPSSGRAMLVAFLGFIWNNTVYFMLKDRTVTAR